MKVELGERERFKGRMEESERGEMKRGWFLENSRERRQIGNRSSGDRASEGLYV